MKTLIMMRTKELKILIIFVFLLIIIQCKKEEVKDTINDVVSSTGLQGNKEETKTENQQKDSILKEEKKDSLLPNIAKEDFAYTTFIFPEGKKAKDSAMSVFKKQYSKEEQSTILALNRLDLKNIWRADTLSIPNKIETDFLKYSPFPLTSELLKDVNKFVVFSYPIQAYGVYENGMLVKWGPTSMGKKTAKTKTGLMFVNWKKELSTSTVSDEWKLPYNVNVHNLLGIGWHQYDLPGYPASHSCLRLSMDDAKWMYQFADTWILNKGGATVKANGTPVLVFGEYGWGKAKPWKTLDKNPKATEITDEQLTAEIQPFIDKILGEQQKREEVLASIPQKKTVEDTVSVN